MSRCPDVSQVYSGTEITEPDTATSKNAATDKMSDNTTAGTATRCARSLMRQPPNPKTRKVANGRRGMRAYNIRACPSSFVVRAAQWERMDSALWDCLRGTLHASRETASLPFQQVELLHVDRGSGPMQSDDDCESDGNLRSGHRESKKDEHLAAEILKVVGK